MDGGTIGLMGGIAGSILGLAGGAIGTYFSIKRTNTPRERAFVIRCAMVTWIFLVLFLVGLFLLPVSWKWMIWLPYAIFLPVGIRFMNRRQMQIQAEEADSRPARPVG